MRPHVDPMTRGESSMSELLWIAVPHGLRRRRRRRSVSWSCRGSTEVDIAEAGLADWPTTLVEEVSFAMRTRTSVGETDR